MMIYAFGACVLDTQLHVLSRAGQVIKLRPKAFEVLVYLVEHHDRVVSKDELCAQVWPNQFISDATLGSTVRAVRQAIGDTGEAQQFIQTVHGYGYRCVATVTVYTERRAAPATEPAPVLAPLAPLADLGAVEHRATTLEQTSVQPGQPFSTLTPLRHGERKVVTMLCCTPVLPSAVLGQPDLDTLHSLMWGFYRCVRDAVQHYGGDLKPLTGDRVLAVFGAPVAYEDHAVRAGLAALVLLQRVDEWQRTAGIPADAGLAVQIGLHTGPVVVGGFGEVPELLTALVGDVAARATALQEQAAPSTVLCSAAPPA
jgi:DNA-binding winged helix-turn-helix (wHTH) protein